MRTCSECTACRRTRHQDRPRSRFPCHLRWHTRSYAPPTQRRRRWIERSVATRRVGPARWIERSAATHWHAPGARVGPAGGSLVVVDEVDASRGGGDALRPPGRQRRRRWTLILDASLVLWILEGSRDLGAVIGEHLTSAAEDEHLDFTDRSHGELARLVGQQAVSLEHGLVLARPVV